MRIQHLLVPVDFSAASEKAIAYAAMLAKKWGSKLILVHGYQVAFATYERPPMAPTVNPMVGTGLSEKELSKEKITNFLAAFPQLDDIEHEEVVGLGSAVDVIRRTAEGKNADIIVMGTSGASDVEGFFIGTNSEKVSRKASCPVLVIPEDLKSYSINTVCLALDSLHLDPSVTLDLLTTLLTAFGAKLRIIHIADDDDTAFKKEELLSHYKTSLGQVQHSFHVFYSGDPEEGIEEFLDNHPIDMMALLHREHGFFERLFQPGVRRKMIFKTKVPLLILK